MTTTQDVINSCEELINDPDTPKNLKEKINEIIKHLKNENQDESVRYNKAMDILEELSNDVNLPSYTRMQILTIISLLESANT